MPIPSNSKYVHRISVPMYWHRCWNLSTLQLQITRVDPFNNGSCHSNDSLEAFSVYKEKTKGSKYSVQVCRLFSNSLLYIFRMLKPRASGHMLADNSQHCWMLHLALVFTSFCMLLRVAGSCCAKFETVQTFSYVQKDAATRKIVAL